MSLDIARSATVQRYGHPDDLPPDAKQLFAEYGNHHMESSLDWYRNLDSWLLEEIKKIRIRVAETIG